MIFHVLSGGNSFNFQDNAYNRSRFLDFLKKADGKMLRVEVEEQARPKSDEALGYWWGALLPAIIARDYGHSSRHHF